jgi:hypothetical protein
LSKQQTMPAFVFARRHDIELEAGFILAGMLIVDLPRKVELTENEQQMVGAILQKLTDAAQSGRMPADALVYGWHGGGRPPDAVDTGNDEMMAAWARDCLTIGVRVDPRNDGWLTIDSDLMRQLEEADPPAAPSGRRRQ